VGTVYTTNGLWQRWLCRGLYSVKSSSEKYFGLLQFEEDFDIIVELKGLFVLRSLVLRSVLPPSVAGLLRRTGRRVATTENGVA